MLRAKNKATKLFEEVMGKKTPQEEGQKKKPMKQPSAYYDLPGPSSPNGIGPIY